MKLKTQNARLEEICLLRWVVGVLGSKKSAGWWDCSFLDETGIGVLGAIFPRSAKGAALKATVGAAQRVHDEALGGRHGCWHLFRLPPDQEDRLEELKGEPEAGSLPLDHDAAMVVLERLADPSVTAPPGPVQVGTQRRILTENSIRELASHYRSAFRQDIRCFPYFGADPA